MIMMITMTVITRDQRCSASLADKYRENENINDENAVMDCDNCIFVYADPFPACASLMHEDVGSATAIRFQRHCSALSSIVALQ